MKFRLLTIILPYDTVTLAKGLRYSTLSVSKEETNNTDGVRFISKDIQPNPDPNGPPIVHTLKNFYLDKRIPSFYRKFLPSSSLSIIEECWSTELTSTGERIVTDELRDNDKGQERPPLTDQKVRTIYRSDYFKKLDIRVNSVIARANIGNSIQGDIKDTIRKLFGDVAEIEDKNAEITNDILDLTSGYRDTKTCSVVFKLIMVDFPYALRSMCESFVIKKIAGVMKDVHRTVVRDEPIWIKMSDEELDEMEEELMKPDQYRGSKQVVDPPSRVGTENEKQNINTNEVPPQQYPTQSTMPPPEPTRISPPHETPKIRDAESTIPKLQPEETISRGIGSDPYTQKTAIPYPPQMAPSQAKGTSAWATGPTGGV